MNVNDFKEVRLNKATVTEFHPVTPHINVGDESFRVIQYHDGPSDSVICSELYRTEWYVPNDADVKEMLGSLVHSPWELVDVEISSDDPRSILAMYLDRQS